MQNRLALFGLPILVLAATFVSLSQNNAVSSHLSPLASLSAFPLDESGPVIRAQSEALKPFTVAGERGVLLGQQNGVFEAWVLPVKLISHFTIEADVEGYGVPIDLNP